MNKFRVDAPRIALTVTLLMLWCAGCSRPPAPETPPPSGFTPEVLGDRPGLHNVIRLTDNLYSGSSPEGEVGFQSLRDLGVKTIITVDGATPEVAVAGRFGMRYVHLPIGYDGVPRETAVKIARAVREMPGPCYIHCHHGKHRGPAAAVAALRCVDGNCRTDAALALLRTAGTDPKYTGLFASVEGSIQATPEEWTKAGSDFPAVARIPDLTRLMVQIDERWDRLKLAKSAGWKAPLNQADLDPTHEAVLLSEHFREASRVDSSRTRNEDFRRMMMSATEAAAELENALRSVPLRPDQASTAFTRSAGLCTRCHAQFRDK